MEQHIVHIIQLLQQLVLQELVIYSQLRLLQLLQQIVQIM